MPTKVGSDEWRNSQRRRSKKGTNTKRINASVDLTTLIAWYERLSAIVKVIEREVTSEYGDGCSSAQMACVKDRAIKRARQDRYNEIALFVMKEVEFTAFGRTLVNARHDATAILDLLTFHLSEGNALITDRGKDLLERNGLYMRPFKAEVAEVAKSCSEAILGQIIKAVFRQYWDIEDEKSTSRLQSAEEEIAQANIRIEQNMLDYRNRRMLVSTMTEEELAREVKKKIREFEEEEEKELKLTLTSPTPETDRLESELRALVRTIFEVELWERIFAKGAPEGYTFKGVRERDPGLTDTVAALVHEYVKLVLFGPKASTVRWDKPPSNCIERPVPTRRGEGEKEKEEEEGEEDESDIECTLAKSPLLPEIDDGLEDCFVFRKRKRQDGPMEKRKRKGVVTIVLDD